MGREKVGFDVNSFEHCWFYGLAQTSLVVESVVQLAENTMLYQKDQTMDAVDGISCLWVVVNFKYKERYLFPQSEIHSEYIGKIEQ